MPSGNQQQKITNGEYERAYTELAGFLYELYRKQRQAKQTSEIIIEKKET